MDFHVQLCRHLLLTLSLYAWQLLKCAKAILRLRRGTRYVAASDTAGVPCPGLAGGKTILVTTGRQAKTVHTVRALKDIGARVIVTDYDTVSASAVSLACDKFVLLPALDPSRLDDWVDSFARILIDNHVDMVIPVSTINEVLFMGVAKQRLQERFPYIQWICPDLETAVRLDDRIQFSAACQTFGVPVPPSGEVLSLPTVKGLSGQYPNGIILKRIESSVNRAEEIVAIGIDDEIPDFIQPSEADPWQWQMFVRGQEYSAWYICVDGKVTFSACYFSEPDLVYFDGTEVPEDLDEALRRFIEGMRLTGQFAFDFIRCDKTNLPYVIECNPRASSILETVSTTPLWAEAFFGVDVTKRTVSKPVGFAYHKNCWPWAARSEGYFEMDDPLPFFCAEMAWPMKAIADKGMTEKWFQKIDVNICKIIVDGPSPARNLQSFRDDLVVRKLSYVEQAVEHMDTVVLDTSASQYELISARCAAKGVKTVLFQYSIDGTDAGDRSSSDVHRVESKAALSKLLEEHSHGETRLIMGSELSKEKDPNCVMSYNVVAPDRSLDSIAQIPLRKLRVMHIMGSCTSEYYEGISSYYGFQCIESIGSDGRFEHLVAYVHQCGKWSVETRLDLEYISSNAPRLNPGEAIAKLESMNADVVVPHMFDYDGLTAYRGLMTVLGLPMVGCSAEALALSTNKARTKACAAMENVRVPKSQLVREGDEVTMPIPFVIKPAEEDNSQGIEVVWAESEIPSALSQAIEFGKEVLCEQFIPLGRELRVAVVEQGDGSMELLPIIEYFLTNDAPIRRPEDKVTLNASGRPNGLAFGGRSCPADVDDVLKEKLFRASVTAHRALGCTDYSIYDYRIDPQGEPYMLESCLYCSFAPNSVLVSMQATQGIDNAQLFVRLCERAIARRAAIVAGGQPRGMKQLK